MYIDRAQMIAYLQRNWFKIGIAALLIFIAFKKDLSFKLNLNTPVRQEQPQQQSPGHEKTVKTERYTELQAAKQPPATDRFDITAAARPARALRAIDRLQQVDEDQIQDYIKRFDRVARSEEKKFGIPAAVTLGNALLNSQAGTAAWATKGRSNHFLLPCTEDWKGAEKSYDGRCLRQYDNAWTSFRDHSFFITTGPYSSLRQLSGDDLQAWAKALEDHGFSKEESYAQQLLTVIEQYRLDDI
jgi:flagellum-specific peptidoglycan hydrolase FlgJ